MNHSKFGGMHPRLAIFLVAAVHGGFAVIGTVNLLRWAGDPVAVYTSVFAIFGCFALQMFHCNPYTRRARERYGWWTLLPQAVMAFAPLPLTSSLSGITTGFLAGAVLVVLRGRFWAWCLYVLIAVAVLVVANAKHFDILITAYLTLSMLAVGLIVYGLSWLSDVVVEQHRQRSRLARVAVSAERLRFARDLHDLLGYSLSAITLKNELTYRLIGSNDERARQEVSETLAIARQALADIRAVVSGYRPMSLSDELESVRGVLAAAGVEVALHNNVGKLEPRASTLLAVVLREAVTNLLRHSRATQCRISLAECQGWVRLLVCNDGARGLTVPATPWRTGSGLDNLSTRLAAVDGALTTTVDGDWFSLRAEFAHTGAGIDQGSRVRMTVTSETEEQADGEPHRGGLLTACQSARARTGPCVQG